MDFASKANQSTAFMDIPIFVQISSTFEVEENKSIYRCQF